MTIKFGMTTVPNVLAIYFNIDQIKIDPDIEKNTQ